MSLEWIHWTTSMVLEPHHNFFYCWDSIQNVYHPVKLLIKSTLVGKGLTVNMSLLLASSLTALLLTLYPWCISQGTHCAFNWPEIFLAARSWTEEENISLNYLSITSTHASSAKTATTSNLFDNDFLNENTKFFLHVNLLSIKCMTKAWCLCLFDNAVPSLMIW